MTASWAERTSRICEVWCKDERSIRDLFQAADPDLSDQQAFTDTISSYLSEHPPLCDRWQDYVNDKRSTPSPLLDLRGPTTGWMTERGEREDVHDFSTIHAATAHFLWMESNWVLAHRRVSVEADMSTQLRSDLCSTLDELIELLESVEEEQWSEWLQGARSRLRAGDSRAIQRLLQAYGGMGSLTDLTIHPLNGHRVDEGEVAEVNEELHALRSQTHREATALGRVLGES
jgi:hypothetical protein